MGRIFEIGTTSMCLFVLIYFSPPVFGGKLICILGESLGHERQEDQQREGFKKAGNKRKRAWIGLVVREMAKLGQIQGWGL